MVIARQHAMADPLESQPIRPEDVSEMAAYYRVDAKSEPRLLWVVRQAVETPLPPNWIETQDDNGRTVYTNEVDNSQSELHPSDAYFVNMINKERAKGISAEWGGAWMEFHDENGQPYFYDFQEDQTSTTRPARLLVAPPDAANAGFADAGVTTGSEQKMDANQRGKAGKLNITELEVLSFRSWWSEAGAYGLSKRNIDIYFNIKHNNFQVVLDNADKIYTISHIQGKEGPLTVWDLHVGAKIDILGRKTTLMQANLATSEWLEYKAKWLTNIRKKLSKELMKYDKKFAGDHDPTDGRVDSGRVVKKKGGQCLRNLQREIKKLKIRLSEFRPSLAKEIAGMVPE